MKSEDIYLFTHHTHKSVLTVFPHLHDWKKEKHLKKYRGKLKFSILEMGVGSLMEGFSTKHEVFFLDKSEAKHLFHLILEHKIQGKKDYMCHEINDSEETFIRKFKIQLCDNRCYSFIISTSKAKENETGTLKIDEASRKEARMFIEMETAEKMALECLDYIRHEELLALQKGEPLQDYVFDYQEPSVEDSHKEEQNDLSTSDLISVYQQIRYNPQTTIEKEMKNIKKKEYLKMNVDDVMNKVNSVKELLKTYTLYPNKISLSKQEIEEVLHSVDEMKKLSKSLKISNEYRKDENN